MVLTQSYCESIHESINAAEFVFVILVSTQKIKVAALIFVGPL